MVSGCQHRPEVAARRHQSCIAARGGLLGEPVVVLRIGWPRHLVLGNAPWFVVWERVPGRHSPVRAPRGVQHADPRCPLITLGHRTSQASRPKYRRASNALSGGQRATQPVACAAWAERLNGVGAERTLAHAASLSTRAGRSASHREKQRGARWHAGRRIRGDRGGGVDALSPSRHDPACNRSDTARLSRMSGHLRNTIATHGARLATLARGEHVGSPSHLGQLGCQGDCNGPAPVPTEPG